MDRRSASRSYPTVFFRVDSESVPSGLEILDRATVFADANVAAALVADFMRGLDVLRLPEVNFRRPASNHQKSVVLHFNDDLKIQELFEKCGGFIEVSRRKLRNCRGKFALVHLRSPSRYRGVRLPGATRRPTRTHKMESICPLKTFCTCKHVHSSGVYTGMNPALYRPDRQLSAAMAPGGTHAIKTSNQTEIHSTRHADGFSHGAGRNRASCERVHFEQFWSRAAL